MAKNIVIAEGTQGKTFTGVEKIRTKLQGGGSQNWIPEDEAGEYAKLKALTVRANGEYIASRDNVAGYKSVKVNVKANTKSISIDHNGTYSAADEDIDGYSSVSVNVTGGGTKLGTLTAHNNGVYNAADKGYDGFSTVNISIKGIAHDAGIMTLYTPAVSVEGDYGEMRVI